MKTILTIGTASLALDLSTTTIAALLDDQSYNVGLVVTVGEPLPPVKRFVTVIVYGYLSLVHSTPTGINGGAPQKIAAIKAIRNAINMGLTEAKQAVEVPSGKRLVVPEDLATQLILDLRSFGYGAERF